MCSVTLTLGPATGRRAGNYGGLVRILDCDSHLYIEPDEAKALLGGLATGDDWVLSGLYDQAAHPDYPNRRAAARTDVWNVKGLAALGAFDAADRVAALDAMGVAAQLVFPNTSLRELRYDSPGARRAAHDYNDRALEWSRATGGRARVVCQLNLHDRAGALAEAERVVTAGARGVLLPCAYAPGGTSPANPQWDPLWRLLEQADVPALLHAGAGGLLDAPAHDPMLFPRGFADSPTLRSVFAGQPGGEERVGPLFLSIVHLAAELFLTVVTMGGVFERFPRLRFGVIEFGAQWFGPLAERLDTHAGLLAKVGAPLPLKPSEYFARNVRVTPYCTEPVDRFIDRYSLAECYVYSSDYPHLEGGRDPIGRFTRTLSRLGRDYRHDFFANNAQLLFPGAATSPGS